MKNRRFPITYTKFPKLGYLYISFCTFPSVVCIQTWNFIAHSSTNERSELMRVTIACSWRQYFYFWLSTLCALVRQASNAWARRSAYQAQGGTTPITGSCTVGPRWAVVATVHFKRDARVYERVQPRLPEVSRCKSALFRSPIGSQYLLAQVVSDMST